VTILEHSPTDTAAEWAKAYCGPAHGLTWQRQGPTSWPPRIVLASRAGPQEYRLVHDPRAHRPARDHLGNTLYMPVPRSSDRAGWSTTA
jgi:hypothetical protein